MNANEQTAVKPCPEHSSILNPSFPWHRAIEVAEDCPDCEVDE